ncbi:MAG: hypothetical protein DSY34_01605 [Desulfurobacterium sp.]|nr:MAG: hypothetical protein DSY34_01605 [Desulfurobacterium sp.]
MCTSVNQGMKYLFEDEEGKFKATTPVKEVMIPDPLSIKPSEKVEKVVKLMEAYSIGSILVVNDDKYPINIVTYSDVLKLMLMGKTDITVSEALNFLKPDRKLITVRSSDPISKCLKIFAEKNIKHLPVLDNKNRLVGILSARDIIRKAALLLFIDNLTQLGNRHYLESIRHRLLRMKNKLGVLFIDIDNFKSINDKYGHEFGDCVLKKVANTIRENVRMVDDVIRYGGEEFVAFLFNANEVVVHRIAERIREKVEALKFEEHPEFKVTVSIGTTLCGSISLLEECITTADKAMYQAKKEGKNKVVFYLPRQRKS